MIFLSPIFFITAIATCQDLISSPCSGRDRKVRCCSGHYCYRHMDWFCGCATKQTAACLLCFHGYRGRSAIFLSAAEFRGSPICHLAGALSSGRCRLKSAAAISRDGDPSSNALSGICRLHVPFAFALGALIMRYPGEKWIAITRRWTMVTWGFLTCGVFLGAHWAYSVLGWGGYWAWDPVENASLMPWLPAPLFCTP